VTLTDGEGATTSAVYSLVVEPAITISPLTLPTPIVGTSYSQQLTAGGGSGSGYIFTSGPLPSGLTLSPSGLLSGTPLYASGMVFTVVITVTDSASGSDSVSYVLTVKQGSQAGDIVSSAPQTFYGENVVLTATFSAPAAGDAPMTGTVAFYDGDNYLGSAPLQSTTTQSVISLGAASPAMASAPTVSGQASLPTTELSVGNHVITAVYSGDINYTPATSETPVSVQVAPATTATTLAATTAPQGTSLIAHVVVTSPGNPPIVGTVSFYDNGVLIGTEPVIDGYASLFIGVLAPGSHTFSAGFSGSGTSSTSNATITVETDGPQVTSVDRYGYHVQPTYLLISFNGSLAPAPTENVANYQIIGPGGRKIKVSSAIYDPATNTVTLIPALRLNLHWKYRFTINGSTSSGLTNPDGALLDGAGTGVPGSNYVTTLSWANLAGKASQLPTRGSASERHSHAKLHTSTIDHLLEHGEIIVPRSSLK
jgi:hypothetical protein